MKLSNIFRQLKWSAYNLLMTRIDKKLNKLKRELYIVQFYLGDKKLSVDSIYIESLKKEEEYLSNRIGELEYKKEKLSIDMEIIAINIILSE